MLSFEAETFVKELIEEIEEDIALERSNDTNLMYIKELETRRDKLKQLLTCISDLSLNFYSTQQ